VQEGVQQPASGRAQAPHWQSLPQLWLPQPPHACWVSGAHAPASPQDPYAPQVQSVEQLRLWLPQLPQPWLCACPGWHWGLVSQSAGWQPASAMQTSPAGQLPSAQMPPQPFDWPQPASAHEATQQTPPRQVSVPVQQLPPPPALTQKFAAAQQALPRQTAPSVQRVVPQGSPQPPSTQLSPLGQTIPAQAAGWHCPWTQSSPGGHASSPPQLVGKQPPFAHASPVGQGPPSQSVG
jgi:hypothetical protein